MSFSCIALLQFDLRIDSHDHAGTAVTGLRAVGPDRGRVVDLDGEDRDLSGIGGDWLVSRLEANDAGVDLVDGNARVAEGSLDNRVVLGLELELDHAANGGLDVVWEEAQRSVGIADLDYLDADIGGEDGGGRGQEHEGARNHLGGVHF